MIIERNEAIKIQNKKMHHHAPLLTKLHMPMLNLIEGIADEVQYHKSTVRFRIGNKWYIARGDGNNDYKEIEVVDWQTKRRITGIPA